MLSKTIKDELRERRKRESKDPNSKRGLIDLIMKVEDIGKGENLDEEQIDIVLLAVFLAGSETSGRAASWATIYLHDNPEVLQKAKVKWDFRKKKNYYYYYSSIPKERIQPFFN